MAGWLIRGAFDVSPGLDDQLCPPEERIAKDVILILDATDEWSEIRKVAVRREVEALRESIERFARISVHVVKPSQVPGETALLTICNPGTIAQIDRDARRNWVHRAMVSNEEVVERYRARFSAVVDSVVAEVGDVPERATSPIIETIRAAAMTSPGGGPAEIYLISDMYQNSDLFSAYVRRDWPLELADSLADVYVQGTQQLAGSEVTILLLSPVDPRPDHDALRRFWMRFFDRQDATLQRVERLEG
jgi:hypothetical protein